MLSCSLGGGGGGGEGGGALGGAHVRLMSQMLLLGGLYNSAHAKSTMRPRV